MKPIFFIGVPRSGTTLLFESFARHEQLGWPSNYSEKFPSIPQFGFVLRLASNRYFNITGEKKQYNRVSKLNKYLPKPAEAYNFWNYYTKTEFSRQYLVDVRADSDSIRQVRDAVCEILRWEAKQRFSAKLTGPSRINYLKSIFPDAQFIHVIRDGRAVVHSMLNTKSWTKNDFLKKPWWHGGLENNDLVDWQSANHNPAILAAIQWRKIIEIAQEEGSKCTRQGYIEIRYEDFIANPNNILDRLYSWCGLTTSIFAHQFLDKQIPLRNMDNKFRKDMNPETIQLISEKMEPILGKLGYN